MLTGRLTMNYISDVPFVERAMLTVLREAHLEGHLFLHQNQIYYVDIMEKRGHTINSTLRVDRSKFMDDGEHAR